MTFTILDSMPNESKEIRDFYLPAYKSIANKADGALAEVIGYYSMQYIEKYTIEFFRRYEDCNVTLDCKEFKKIAYYVQYEIGMSAAINFELNRFQSVIETHL